MDNKRSSVYLFAYPRRCTCDVRGENDGEIFEFPVSFHHFAAKVVHVEVTSLVSVDETNSLFGFGDDGHETSDDGQDGNHEDDDESDSRSAFRSDNKHAADTAGNNPRGDHQSGETGYGMCYHRSENLIFSQEQKSDVEQGEKY